jgi:UDP-N-acetylmuramate: L-alanyl-gamma-D-glutamyl-meso-diaminopimelate ligase
MSEKRRFHLVPVGGTAMVPLAALLVEEGHRVTGSDRALYPPMSTLIEKLGIPVAQGFAPEHVPDDCDTVIVGNAALRDNVEAAEAARRGLPVLSLPQAVRQHLLPGKTAVVITGTHGKTTTSALASWLLLD